MLENRDVLAVDQDTLGRQGTLLSQQGDAQVWVKPLANGDRAVALFNRGENAATIAITAAAVGLPHAAAYGVRNLWSHAVTESAGTLSAAVPPHGVVMYRVSAAGAGALANAPEVTLSPVTTPAAYPGSDLRLAVPGKPLTVTSAIQNDGRLPIMSGSVRLAAPAGWTVEPAADTRLGVIPGGRRETLSWTVTPPADADPGPATLTATATYRWGLRHREAVASDAAVQVPSPAPSGEVDLAHLPWLRATSGWMTPQVDGTVGGGPLRIDGTTYATGIGVASPSVIEYYAGGQCSSVTATVGIDDAADFDPTGGTATFQVLGDGKVLYDSGLVERPGAQTFSVPVTGATVLTLQVGDGGDGGYNDRTDWIDVHADCAG
jgi:alpha-galactosidase